MIDEIISLTDQLRKDPDPLFAACRDVLRRHGVDPEQSFLLDHYPDDPGLEQIYLWTPNRRVILVDIEFLPNNQIRESYWGDETDNPETQLQLKERLAAASKLS